MEEMILELPDTIPVYPPAQKNTIPPTGPSHLELYFISKIPNLTSAELGYHQAGALTPQNSIDCLRDKVRTKLFMQGIAEALGQIDTAAQETIEVCDAGAGAIPVMAIYAALCSDKVRCTALELNPRSAQLARDVVEQFGLQDRIMIVEADATTYVPAKPIDLLISETMHSGLTAEPIVQILSNLQPYVKQGGITLPSAVGIKAAIVPLRDFESPQGYTRIVRTRRRVINPTWQDVVQYVPGQPLDKIEFAFDTTGLPDGEYHVAVTNSVVIGSRTLGPYQSLITVPQYLTGASRETVEEFTIRSDQPGSSSELAVSYTPGSILSNVGKLR
jgi:precorrin-6B methylase 2